MHLIYLCRLAAKVFYLNFMCLQLCAKGQRVKCGTIQCVVDIIVIYRVVYFHIIV